MRGGDGTEPAIGNQQRHAVGRLDRERHARGRSLTTMSAWPADLAMRQQWLRSAFADVELIDRRARPWTWRIRISDPDGSPTRQRRRPNRVPVAVAGDSPSAHGRVVNR